MISSNKRQEQTCVDLGKYERYLNQIWYNSRNSSTRTSTCQCSDFIYRKNSRWRWLPYWISGNANISRCCEDMCTKFGGKMQVTKWPKNQNWKLIQVM